MSSEAICEKLKLKRIPQILTIYLFCSPSLNGEFRCLPRQGGYLDQDNIDMVGFGIIEGRIASWQKRKKANASHPNTTVHRGNIRKETIPL